MNNDLREKLAEYSHSAWSQWVAYMFDKCIYSVSFGGDKLIIPNDLVLRWQRQMDTPYADLPEHEKEIDRAEADKMLAIVNEATPRQAADFLRQNHDKDWIVSLLVCLLDPAAEGRHTR